MKLTFDIGGKSTDLKEKNISLSAPQVLFGTYDQQTRVQQEPSDDEQNDLDKSIKEESKELKEVAEKPKKEDGGDDDGEDGDDDLDAKLAAIDDDGDEDSEDDGDEEAEDENEDEVSESSSPMFIPRETSLSSSKRALIIAGFPGVGKSEFTKLARTRNYTVVDADSGKFNKVEFPDNYMRHIKRMITERDIVLVSARTSVLEALEELGLEYILVIPRPELKELYMENYKRRGSSPEWIEHMDNSWHDRLDSYAVTNYSTLYELNEGQYLSDIANDILGDHGHEFR